jgi:hypothetical protein
MALPKSKIPQVPPEKRGTFPPPKSPASPVLAKGGSIDPRAKNPEVAGTFLPKAGASKIPQAPVEARGTFLTKGSPPQGRTAPKPTVGKVTGRANALTRGQGKKVGLKAIYAGIKQRAIKAGYRPDQKDIEATYRRSQAKRKLPKPKA